jgi:actin
MDDATVVIDLGSGFTKAGFSGEVGLRTLFPSIVGRSRNRWIDENVYVGDECARKRDLLDVKRVLEGGAVADWDDIKRVLHKTFYDLRLAPEDQRVPVLLTLPFESPQRSVTSHAPHTQPEKTMQVMFESFATPLLHLANSASLSLLAARRKTGLVVDFGYAGVQIVPVYDGLALTGLATRFEVGGRDVDDCLIRLLAESKGYSFSTSAMREVAVRMKETLCYVAADLETEAKRASAQNNELERKFEILGAESFFTLTTERFQCTEVFFSPKLIGRDSDNKGGGLPRAIAAVVDKCDCALQETMLGNIVLCGASSLFPGLAERLAHEVRALVQAKSSIGSSSSVTVNVDVVAPLDRRFLAWEGGALLATDPSFASLCATKSEYDEFGPLIALRKFNVY